MTLKEVKNEVALLRKLQSCKSIIRLYGLAEQRLRSTLVLVTELCVTTLSEELQRVTASCAASTMNVFAVQTRADIAYSRACPKKGADIRVDLFGYSSFA